jgi:hypothetical protein
LADKLPRRVAANKNTQTEITLAVLVDTMALADNLVSKMNVFAILRKAN